jgi:predicted TIM-barrel fold metal-dependent hydrolase
MKIDAFCHVLPRPYYDRLQEISSERAANLLKRTAPIRSLYDVDERLRVIEPFEDYAQIISLAAPPIEALGEPAETVELALLANDSMAELVGDRPDTFLGFVAGVPINDVDATLTEIDRAIGDLGALGIQLYTHFNGLPPDDPRFEPVFARMAELDRPIWVHPARNSSWPDYPTEAKSKFEIWWLFGWPYETSAFMARLVFSGMFDKLPKLKIITHHLGAMAPYFVNRIGYGMDQFGSRTSDEDYEGLLKRMKKRPLDYFRMFYGDTSVNGAKSAIQCGLDFYGVSHVLFGTDCPFDPQGGPLFIRETIKALDGMKLKPEDRRRIYFGNALGMLKLKLPQEASAKK